MTQYRVHVEDADGAFRREYTDPDTGEAVVDGLTNGVEYTVTVQALTNLGGESEPSEAQVGTPRAGDGSDPGEDVPVPAVPLAGAAVLAVLLVAAGLRRRE